MLLINKQTLNRGWQLDISTIFLSVNHQHIFVYKWVFAILGSITFSEKWQLHDVIQSKKGKDMLVIIEFKYRLNNSTELQHSMRETRSMQSSSYNWGWFSYCQTELFKDIKDNHRHGPDVQHMLQKSRSLINIK